jgi:hypothetical protein
MGMMHGAFLVHEAPPQAQAPVAAPPAGMHDHGHGGHAAPPPQWMKDLLEKSAAAVETLRRTLRP